MENIKKIEGELKKIFLEIKKLSDSEFGELVDTGIFNELLLSIVDPKDSQEYKNIQERLLRNKNRLSLLALMRYAIQENYSFKGNVDGKTVYISPFYYQWMNNGVIFLQGKEKWQGMIGFYDEDGNLYYAKSKRAFNGGDQIDLRKDLFFDFFYEKIKEIKDINPEEKKELLEKVDKIKNENELSKIKVLLINLGKWLDEKTDRVWYNTVKAYFDSIHKN